MPEPFSSPPPAENALDACTQVRPWRHIRRRESYPVKVGDATVGGDAPISVQSMTNTQTSDATETLKQIEQIQSAGADIVRVSCPDEDSTVALREITRYADIPVVADIHFHYQRAIEAANAGAACIRINPGNIGDARRVREVIKAARDNGCSMRIGVNGGSLERHLLERYKEPCPEAMVESALAHAALLQDNDFHQFKISVKASDVFLATKAYQSLAKKIDCPLHLGITEAGGAISGTVKSAIGIGMLLYEGIGDTIRVSLSADPVEEVRAGFEILKSLGLRRRGVTIISCPSCARQGFDVIKTVALLEQRLEHIAQPVTLSIIGCVVNGPGEAALTDIGFTGGGKDAGMLYVNGRIDHKLSNDKMIDELVKMVEAKAQQMHNQE